MRLCRTSFVGAIAASVVLVGMVGGHTLGHTGHRSSSSLETATHSSHSNAPHVARASHPVHRAQNEPSPAQHEGDEKDAGAAAAFAAGCAFALAAALVGVRRLDHRAARLHLRCVGIALTSFAPDPPIPKRSFAF